MSRLSLNTILKHSGSLVLLFILPFYPINADDLTISGRVTDNNGTAVNDALVSFSVFSTQFAARTEIDGRYSITINGAWQGEDTGFKAWSPFPNPTSGTVRIPFSIPSTGDIKFDVYTITGAKVYSQQFGDVPAGSYRLVWNGALAGGSAGGAGLYIYALSWGNKTYSGRIIINGNSIFGDGSSYLEPFMVPGNIEPGYDNRDVFNAIATVTATGYHTLRHTGISFSSDTTADFVLSPFDNMPYAIAGDFIGKRDGSGYQPFVIKGINLGSSPPGYFPGEIAYAIPGDTYERWINLMASSGFNAIRVYTLHPPVFYEKLAEYNLKNPDDPLLLFQGIWLEEIGNPTSPDEYNLFLREERFSSNIDEVIDCIHGNKNVPFRPGMAYGEYLTDISPWVAGYIIGREVAPQEVDSTNQFNSSVTGFNGVRFSIAGADPSEVFFTRMLDRCISGEEQRYGNSRPVSISSWPTLDPLEHPTEIYTDEDVMSIDISRISEQGDPKLLFASYHAYPYYPDFVSEDPVYRTYSDQDGPNSYYGYIINLRNHYGDIPLIIGEFGVPSSWGDAHTSYSGMNHGGHSEKEQGENNIRLFRNILNAGGGGGFMFSWMDEWFKRTWIVEYLEAVGFNSGPSFITTRQLWHNIVSPEQNFGLIAFDQEGLFNTHSFIIDDPSPDPVSMTASADNRFLRIIIDTGEPIPEGDSVVVAFDTYRADIGESVIPGGYVIANRSEFMVSGVRGRDTSTLYVSEAYNMKGLTPRFNLTDPDVQKFKSIVSDGASWRRVEWINNGFSGAEVSPGRIRTGYGLKPDPGMGEGLSWNGSRITIDLPWTLIHFFDPTRMRVIDGATSTDGGYHWSIIDTQSDGVSLTLLVDGKVINATSRFSWPSWQVVPSTTERVKASMEIIREGLLLIPDYNY